MTKKDLSKFTLQPGDKFSQLTVQNYDFSKQMYRCLCDCGQETFQSSSRLKRGLATTCGCGKGALVSKFHLKPNYEGILNGLYGNYRRSAKTRGIPFNISREEFRPLLLGNCHYCGAPPSLGAPRAKRYKVADVSQFRYNGVDRVDNSLGYTIGNCVSCCVICNKSKLDLSLDEWFAWLDRLINFQKTHAKAA